MKLIITYILLFVGCILLLFKFLYENAPSTESDMLLRLYYIGGVVSGIFAFGAFFVAILTYYNQKKIQDYLQQLQVHQQITSLKKINQEQKKVNKKNGQ